MIATLLLVAFVVLMLLGVPIGAALGLAGVAAIALANGKRIEKVPAIPTFAELGLKNFEAATWFGVLAPTTLAPTLSEQIAGDIRAVVSQPA